MNTIKTDRIATRAVRRIPVPDHSPGFWTAIERGLAGVPQRSDVAAPAGDAAPLMVLQPNSRTRRVRRHHRVAAVAASLLLIGATAVAVANGNDGQVVPATRSEPTTSTDGTSSTATTASPVSSPPGSEDAVLGFLDALGGGDLTAAAAALGPLSEAYLDATHGSVRDFLTVAEEGYGAWFGSTDRATRVVEIRPGDVIVIVSGTIAPEGTVERRDDAFPARYAQSAGAWFVERWAMAPGADAGIHVRATDAPDRIEVTTGGTGTAWLSVDGASPRQVEVGPDGVAGWTVPQPVDPGQLIVVGFINETTFTAAAWRTA